jgi:hypothetical protein
MVEVIPNREEFRKADAVFSLVTKVCLVLRGNGAVGGGSGARGELGTRVGARELVAWDEIGQFMGSMVLLWREARNHQQRATTPRNGLSY